MCLNRKNIEIKIFVVVDGNSILYIGLSFEMCNFFSHQILVRFWISEQTFFSKLSCYVSENCEKSSMRVMKPEEATRLSGRERPQFLLVPGRTLGIRDWCSLQGENVSKMSRQKHLETLGFEGFKALGFESLRACELKSFRAQGLSKSLRA